MRGWWVMCNRDRNVGIPPLSGAKEYRYQTARRDVAQRPADRRRALLGAKSREDAGAKRAADQRRASSVNLANRRRKHSPRTADPPRQTSPRFASLRHRQYGLRWQSPLRLRRLHRVAEKLRRANSERESPSPQRWRILSSFALWDRGSRREQVS